MLVLSADPQIQDDVPPIFRFIRIFRAKELQPCFVNMSEKKI